MNFCLEGFIVFHEPHHILLHQSFQVHYHMLLLRNIEVYTLDRKAWSQLLDKRNNTKPKTCRVSVDLVDLKSLSYVDNLLRLVGKCGILSSIQVATVTMLQLSILVSFENLDARLVIAFA